MISSRSRRLTLAAMTLSSSMILVDQTAVPLATPDAISGPGASISSSPWLMTANILPLAALMVFGGRLGDLFGMRRTFLAGATMFAVVTTAMGPAQVLAWAIAARAIQGVGAALMMPTALSIVSQVYPILNAEQLGIKRVAFPTRGFRIAAHDVVISHVQAFRSHSRSRPGSLSWARCSVWS